ncbi:MAG: branched-chain amino acid ABC transporter substrate-binding protein [Rhodospirillales bacterium]|nr:branched-chain amino acid ABC transporter substrate-binding protein [Rhodospirillales bacterium]
MKYAGHFVLSLIAVLALGIGMARAEIPIAVVGPMTGKEATFGAQMRSGAEQAVADINAAGGVLGQQLVLEVGDDACDPRQAREVANKVVADGVKLVAGHYCSSSSIPASEVYYEANVIQISPASTNPQLTEAGRETTLRVCGRDDQQGEVAGNFLADNFKDKKIAIVHDKETYSKGLADETKKQLNARGIEEVMYETINKGEKDYSALVSKLKQVGTEVLYYAGYHTEAGLITRQMREQGMDTKDPSPANALATNEYWSITGPLGEGTMMTFGPDPTKDPANAKIVETFEAKGIKPEGYTLYTYAAIQTWVDAVKKAGSLDTDKVLEALKSTKFETVLGPIEFDEKGDVKQPTYVVYVWKDGTYDYY